MSFYLNALCERVDVHTGRPECNPRGRCDLIRCRVGDATLRRNLLMSDCERFRDWDERRAELKIGPCTECGPGIIALSFACGFHVQFAIDFSTEKILLQSAYNFSFLEIYKLSKL